MAIHSPSITLEEAIAVLTTVLHHGWGDVRVVIQDHQITTIYPGMVLKTPQDIDKFVRAEYAKSASVSNE